MASLVLQNGSYTKTLSFTGSSNETVDLTGWGVNSKSANGYLKLANGLIVQWGTTPSNSNSTSYQAFPITFPTLCIPVLTGVYGSGLSDSVHMYGYTTSGLTMKNSNGVTLYATWIAIGY